MVLEFVFLPLGIASVLAVQHTPAPSLSLLRQEVKHSYTVLVGKCEGQGPRRARTDRGQANALMDARKIKC
jgi:hypothetical protein